MATRDDVLELSAAYADLRKLATDAVRSLWAELDTSRPLVVRAALEGALPDLTAAYGDVAAAVSADFYDNLRQRSGAPGRFTALLADPVPAAQAQARARWAIGPLFSSSPDPSAALGRLEVETDRMTLQPGRDTIGQSAARDPARPRWARVPQGAKTCAFCLTMASRGPVYQSEQSAGGGTDWHGGCDCTATPVWDADPLPDGYDPDALYSDYAEARRRAGGSDLKSILSELRVLKGIN